MPQEIPGLPAPLDAFPVYRVHERKNGSERYELLRLTVEAAAKPTHEQLYETLQALPAGTRNWLTRQVVRKAASIHDRFKEEALATAYHWCTAGLVRLDLLPPRHEGNPGPLIGWKLTEGVSSYANNQREQTEQETMSISAQLAEARARLADHPLVPLLLASDAMDIEYKSHLLIVAENAAEGTILAGRMSELRTYLTDGELATLLVARQQYRDYKPVGELARGGQAIVFSSRHKHTDQIVAVKRAKSRDDSAVRRMRREIEVAEIFGGHPHIMPILDASPDGDWFVMPLAQTTALLEMDQLRQAQQLKAIVMSVLDGLRKPHAKGWIHRDIKPENILKIQGRWVVADWGIGKRPHGQTSTPGHTRAGTLYGTEGYAAPELSDDAHKAGPEADIYSVGQLIGAILTGRVPQANIPLLPDDRGWREVVAAATAFDPQSRPSDVDEFEDLCAPLWHG
ncbi:serine/threonine-protein kinase [Micromonospora carbonacea]|uniref:non-specific serine/threonine protein kinase n=1 Tax=Micromonospora carbonacea TaxID=47853 RepID=A0A7H8XG74_9ACTN|nr:serine/threonine-protein kinase [Micromonospora carbonacea]MBB5828597.1 serine/threonine-protein kinase [Micromonospora carbonacea]QLD23815.1 serine/threonine protein kinase [Micromonospora carbonacea]